MQWMPKIIAILIIIDGIVVMLRPDFLKKYCLMFSRGAGIYLAAAIKALVGIAILFGVSEQCRYEWILIAFGILALAGAAFVIAAPQKARAIAGFFAEKSTTTLRLLSVVYLLMGAILIYSS
ncbi:MAG TPA: hypothetical protein DDW84_06165 [Phycisphaerales bacterium]|nr:MAG: hypothetical protein A2Y13_08370 [Planctomycetes bacterium GWC2_45_44]HBG78417.1 hypothetical protein [Phycisphaerales bacterium]HBR19700.1 hypothetical protein [Phycisphaerales bacterium]